MVSLEISRVLLSGVRCEFGTRTPLSLWFYLVQTKYAQARMSGLPQPSQLKAWKEALLLDYPSLTPSTADFAVYSHVEACRKAALTENKMTMIV
jgi:hypothetical protein